MRSRTLRRRRPYTTHQLGKMGFERGRNLRKGTTITKEMFLNHLYGGGMHEPELKISDVFVCKLRKKLAQATGGSHYIETIWGRGYVLRDAAIIPPNVSK
jgi:DNA-binding winged helix-turn-helix (wHTH) protein